MVKWSNNNNTVIMSSNDNNKSVAQSYACTEEWKDKTKKNTALEKSSKIFGTCDGRKDE